MKRHSTGALDDEARARQDARYRENPKYDVLIIGTGMAALTAAALLAHAGRRVAMLEAHDIPGGYVHSFKMGAYHFCAQIHYIWGCGPGEQVTRFLERVGLDQDIVFDRLDPDGYDHIILPDRQRVRIPNGWDGLVANVEAAYPGQGAGVRAFTEVLDALSAEVARLPEPVRWVDVPGTVLRSPNLIRYHDKTVDQVFDRCQVGREARAVLMGNSGNFMCPPRELSILAYNSLFSGYNRGAYYPRRHFKHLIDRIVAQITSHEGCDIYYEHEVTEVHVEGDRVSGVTTRDGKTFQAETILCNADPQRFSQLIGPERFPGKWKKPLQYDYSASAVTVYLGLRGIDLREHGFGRHNTWHLEQWDLNQTWTEALAGDWSRPWVFMATPTLHTDEGGTCPPGEQILELATAADYQRFRTLKEQDPSAYLAAKREVYERLLDVVEAHHVPHLRDHIALHVSGSPTTNEDFCWAPRGHAYAQALTPKNLGLGRLKSATPWKNFFWCNAASGYPGVCGTVGTGMRMYMELTGDRFYEPHKG